MIRITIKKELQANKGHINLNINLEIEKGTFLTIYGESGVGKTSTLRMISGLLNPDFGEINVNNDDWFNSNKRINRPPQYRKVGFVFQDFALFPNMTVRENLEFAQPKIKNLSSLNNIIDIIEIGELQNRKSETLSGGQKQRVALARALVQQPKILLLDEPLSSLDIKMRLKLQEYILKVHKEFNLTTILISHDIGEIIKLSDRVVVLENGKITKIGNPLDIFLNHEISGKFRFYAEILKIEKQDVIYVVTALAQNQLVKVVAQENDIMDLEIGDKVMLVSKAFNPIIYKVS